MRRGNPAVSIQTFPSTYLIVIGWRLYSQQADSLDQIQVLDVLPECILFLHN